MAAFRLYCLLPFGQLDSRTPAIVDLAQALGRSPASVAMKLVNLASLDPEIRNSGRRGLANASQLDRAVWKAFHEDWGALEAESEAVFLARGLKDPADAAARRDPLPGLPEETSVERLVQARRGQGFFRRAVLASYGYACCMSGLEGSSLLLASHIKPWAEDRENRLNPSNGLCLPAWWRSTTGICAKRPSGMRSGLRHRGSSRRKPRRPSPNWRLQPGVTGGADRDPTSFA